MKPRRSILSVPGHIEKMHHKAAVSSADVLMLDLEDSVPVDVKETARSQVIDSLQSMDWQGKTITFRMNALDTPFGYRDLLEVVETAGHLVDSVVVPKINDPGDVHFVSRMLDGIEMGRTTTRPLSIEASIETAAGMERVADIAKSSDRVCALVFGIADYQASIGARLVSISGHGEHEEDIYPGHRWNFAMSRMVMAAKASGLLAIDAPYGNFRDPDGLRRATAMSCALGFDGKWAIHPAQIDTINDMFSPSEEDIERAGRILEAAQEAEKKGQGAIAVDGRMVDQATVRLARQVWEQAVHLKLREP
ncbi:Similar to citrate lyase beta chain, 2 [Olavius algarvensis associated proteobacterium Delta 3]|nr:Similar to citrate lyase beta chain, 2 [Olavius algarvensis associated proteobacterium Delta 3]CAB5151870.1 Similar to citrate lyase beta chain, 2 [Olavius algarvensis associated proteobacterium Delta 3]